MAAIGTILLFGTVTLRYFFLNELSINVTAVQ